MMPTVAAGTFALNCAYFGIPCIGNEDVDTQSICHPNLSFNVSDIHTARMMANVLKGDLEFYDKCSKVAKEAYHTFYSVDVWKNRIKNYLG